MNVFLIVMAVYYGIALLAIRPLGKRYFAEQFQSELSEPNCHKEAKDGQHYKWYNEHDCRWYCKKGCWRSDITQRTSPRNAWDAWTVLWRSLGWPAFLIPALILKAVPETSPEKDLRIKELERQIEEFEETQ